MKNLSMKTLIIYSIALMGLFGIVRANEVVIGPNGNFSSLPDISKWILTLGMILGRLELFAILVLFLPSFWRN